MLPNLDFAPKSPAKSKKKPVATQKTLQLVSDTTKGPSTTPPPVDDSTTPTKPESSDLSSRDNSFRQFRRLCEDLEKEPSYNSKTKLVSNYLKHGNSGSKGHVENGFLLGSYSLCN